MHNRKQRSYRTRRGAHLGQMIIGSAILAVVMGGSNLLAPVADADTTTTITVTLTPQGCKPNPATAPTGAIDFNVTNKNASSVTEAELRTSDLSHILGEQENLIPGLSGGFSVNLGPGKYVMDCPGAAQRHWAFTVTGKQKGTSWQSVPALKSAVANYATYINQNTQELITSTSALCTAINSGNLSTAKVAYPKSRIYYERIEPVAEIWGALDTQIDGRWENPVTVLSQFVGFHRIEQLLWENNTLIGTPALCAGLVKTERQLAAL
ncbi:MAG: imelysin family protein [Actinomycetota bacterium]